MADGFQVKTFEINYLYLAKYFNDIMSHSAQWLAYWTQNKEQAKTRTKLARFGNFSEISLCENYFLVAFQLKVPLEGILAIVKWPKLANFYINRSSYISYIINDFQRITLNIYKFNLWALY